MPFDKSIKQGGKEFPSLFNLMMKSAFRKLQKEWNDQEKGVKLRGNEANHEQEKVSHMIFADNCYLSADTKSQMLKMIGDASGRLKEKGLDWTEDEMELMSECLQGKVEDLWIVDGGKEYRIKEVDSSRAMGALITKEADPMSALKFRMNKADKAM